MTNSKKEDLSKANYIVSFISLLSSESEGYARAAEQMMNEVVKQPGFIAVYSARDENGVGITNSYWRDIEAIKDWKQNGRHLAVQEKGKKQWYHWYQLQICEIQRAYESGFSIHQSKDSK